MGSRCSKCGSQSFTMQHYADCPYYSGLHDQWVSGGLCSYVIPLEMYECIMMHKGQVPMMMHLVAAVKLLVPRDRPMRPTYRLAKAIVKNVWSGHVRFSTTLDGIVHSVQVPGEVM